MNVIEKLRSLNACKGAIGWVKNNNLDTIEEIIAKCERGDWLLWLAQKVNVDIRTLTLAKALCAKTVSHLMTDERSLKSLEVAERYGRGIAKKMELDAYASYAAARKNNQKQTADVCREVMGDILIQKFLES